MTSLKFFPLKKFSMDTISIPKGKVCVTGASGFLASWLIKRLLESGYQVIGTVRDPENSKKISHLWALEGAKERLRLVKANLLEEGSFDDAVLGCQGVFHTASPVIRAQSDLKSEILDSAIEGTLNVLRSCRKNSALRRVVLTSSSSAVRVGDNIDPNIPLDESKWSSVELCERLKLWYPLAKTLAERAAWEFAEKNDIDLVTVLPSFIIGPSLPHDLSLTASNVFRFLRGGKEEFSWQGRMGYVHIDDVAGSHIIVYEDAAASGRYICSSTVLDNNELGALVSKKYPWLPIPKRFDDYYDGKIPQYTFNTSKLENLGLKFKGIGEMFDDFIQSLKDRGYDLYCPL